MDQMNYSQEGQVSIKFECDMCLIALPDDGQTLQSLSKTFTEKGFKPFEIKSTGEALIYCRQVKFAFIVVTDEDPQLIKNIRSSDGLNSGTPVIAVSASEILPESTLDLFDRRLIQEIVLKTSDGAKFESEIYAAVDRVMRNISNNEFARSLSPVMKIADNEPHPPTDSLPSSTEAGPFQMQAQPRVNMEPAARAPQIHPAFPGVFPWILPQAFNPMPFLPFGAVAFSGKFPQGNIPTLRQGGALPVGTSEGNPPAYPPFSFPGSVHPGFNYANNNFLPPPQFAFRQLQPIAPAVTQNTNTCIGNNALTVQRAMSEPKMSDSEESLQTGEDVVNVEDDVSAEIKQKESVGDLSVKECILPGIEQLLRPISPRVENTPILSDDSCEQTPRRTHRTKAPRCTLRESVIRQQAAMEFPDVTMDQSEELDYSKCPFSILRRPHFETFEETQQGMETIADPNLSPADRHNAKERHRRLRIVKAAEFFKSTLPCMEETMDKATAIELASYYVLFMRNAFNKRNATIVPSLHKTFKEEWQKVFEMENVVQV